MPANVLGRSGQYGVTDDGPNREQNTSDQLITEIKKQNLKDFDTPLSRIACAAIVCEINEHGVRRVADPIPSKG